MFPIIRRIMAAAALAAGLTAQAADTSSQASKPTLYVYSTINALLAGTFDGEATVADLQRHGDFGIGTFNGLDGELIAVDGTYYHVRADGTVKVAAPDERTPLAYVVAFKAEKAFTLPTDAAGSLKALETVLDKQLGRMNTFWAVRIDAHLDTVTTRAIPSQHRPYPTLAQASQHQSTWTKTGLDGVLVGLRSPTFSSGISVPGWHWHFLSADKSSLGGHVLAASVASGNVRAQALRGMQLEVPSNIDFDSADQRERAADLKQVEGER